jgi:hypothetical protein
MCCIILGASANSLVYDVENAAVFRVTLVGMGTAFGVIGLVITWKFAKKELQKVRYNSLYEVLQSRIN